MDDQVLVDRLADLPRGTELVLTFHRRGIDAVKALRRMCNAEMVEADNNTYLTICAIVGSRRWKGHNRVFSVRTTLGFASLHFVRELASALASLEVRRPEPN